MEPGFIEGPIIATDLERFNTYAHRIRVCTSPFSGVERSSFSKILEANHATCLLPRLYYFSTDISHRIDALSFFLNPTLHVFNVTLPGPEHSASLIDALTILKHKAQLVHLDLQGDLNTEMFNLVTQMPTLETISLANVTRLFTRPVKVDCDFLYELASSSLHHLSMDGHFEYVSVKRKMGPRILLSRLESLSLDIQLGSIVPLSRTFAHADLPALKKLSINFYYHPDIPCPHNGVIPETDWSTFCRSLRICLPKTLSRLELASFNPTSRQLAFAPFLDVLCELPCLVWLSTVGKIFRHVTQADIQRLVESLNHLYRLQLPLQQQLPLPFDVLLDVTRRLSELEYLVLEVDFNVLPDNDVVDPVWKSKLRTLVLYGTGGGPSTYRVAALVDSLLPGLLHGQLTIHST